MNRWSMSRINKVLLILALCGGFQLRSEAAPTADAQREPVTMKVVAVNPSSEKTRTVPVRIDLPSEIKPADIIDHGELEVDFDTERSLWYVHKDDVQLTP